MCVKRIIGSFGVSACVSDLLLVLFLADVVVRRRIGYYGGEGRERVGLPDANVRRYSIAPPAGAGQSSKLMPDAARR